MTTPTRTHALTARTVEVADPGELAVRLPDPGGCAWVRQGQGMVAWGEAARVEAGAGSERFATACAELRALLGAAAVHDEVGLPGTGPLAFASFTFDPDRAGSVVVVPEFVLGRRDGRAWLTKMTRSGVGGGSAARTSAPLRLPAVQTLPDHGRIRYAGATFPEVRWMEAVDAAVRAIQAGELAKVVLARDVRVWSQQPLDPRTLVRRLAAAFPDCFAFACAGLVGATPELLLRRQGCDVESVPLAGSAARGGDPDEDARIGRAMLSSGKYRSEHRLAVDSVAEALAPRCAALHVDAEPWLLRLRNIQHLASTVRGVLARSTPSLELVGALHPTAAVGGTPSAVAQAYIRRAEAMDRGRYAGPVGWTDADGNGEWAIALRCAEVSGTRARLFTGNGIVAGSLPEVELEETRLKLLAMQSVLEV